MLLPAHIGEFTHTIPQLLAADLVFLVEGLTSGCQLMIAVGTSQQGIDLAVERRIPIVARAVTAVVADVERLVALGRCRHFVIDHLIRIIGAIGLPWIGLQLV